MYMENRTMYGSSIRLKTERVQRDKEALNRKNKKKSAAVGQENGKLSIKTCKSDHSVSSSH